LRRKNRAGDPFLCFVLHRMGFLMRPRLHEGPVGSYPAFSTLPRTTFRRQRALNFAVSLRPKVVRGGIFSVILSVPWSFRPKLPRFSRGMLPSGVRTFLWHKTVAPATTRHSPICSTNSQEGPAKPRLGPARSIQGSHNTDIEVLSLPGKNHRAS